MKTFGIGLACVLGFVGLLWIFQGNGPNTVEGCVACRPPVRQELTQVRHERDLLASALGRILVRVGMLRADASTSGPELLAVAEAFLEGGNPHV